MDQDEKKGLGCLLTWVAIHLCFLLIMSDGIFSSENMGTDNFWPFNGSDTYDITEFLFYTIFPFLLLIIIHLFTSKEGE